MSGKINESLLEMGMKNTLANRAFVRLKGRSCPWRSALLYTLGVCLATAVAYYGKIEQNDTTLDTIYNTVRETVKSKPAYTVVGAAAVQDAAQYHVQPSPVPMGVDLGPLFEAMKDDSPCTSALHVGVPYEVIRAGETILVNPRMELPEEDAKQVLVKETDPFYPDRREERRRFKSIRVSYVDTESNQVQALLDGAAAVCVQHLLELFQKS